MGHRNIQLQVAQRANASATNVTDTPPAATDRKAELAALSWPDLRRRATEAGIATKGKDRAALTRALLAK